MRDSTYVVIALALCSLVMLAMSMKKPRAMYVLDLEDFKALPVEIRSALRRMLPDPVAIRQGWSHMSSDEKQNAIQYISGFIPHHRPPPPQYRPQYRNHMAPAPKLDTIVETPVIAEETAPGPDEAEPDEAEPSSLKKGFLDTVKKGKKKDTKNKKENEVIALGAVGTDVSLNGSGPNGGFLGRDD